GRDLVSPLRQTMGEPAVPRAEVEDRERPASPSFERPQDPGAQRFEALLADTPDVAQRVVVPDARERPIIRRIGPTPALGSADGLIVAQERLEDGRALRMQEAPDARLAEIESPIRRTA